MKSRIKELDALRGITAIMVVLFHYTMFKPEAEYGFKLGVTGVDLFFMISGFVIFMSIEKVSSGKEFIVNRFTRLYPTYWTCVTITALLKLVSDYYFQNPSNLGITQYMANLTMFQHYLKIEDLDGPYWTMIIEMVFYICMVLLFTLNKIKHILPIGLTLLFIIGLYCIFLETSYPTINAEITYWFPLYTHFPLFLAGIIFYKIMQKEGKSYLNYLFLALCFIVQSQLFDNTPRTGIFISYHEYVGMLVFYFTIFIFFVNHKISFIATKPLLFLGKISFSLYLIHQFISIDLIIPQLQKHGIENFWVTSLIALATSLTIATLITFFIEIQFGKKMNHFLRLKLKLPLKHNS